MDRCFRLDMVDGIHACEDLFLRDIAFGLDAAALFFAAGDNDRGGDGALGMRDLLTGIFVSDRAGIALHAEDLLALKFHCELAAHGAADTRQILFFHNMISPVEDPSYKSRPHRTHGHDAQGVSAVCRAMCRRSCTADKLFRLDFDGDGLHVVTYFYGSLLKVFGRTGIPKDKNTPIIEDKLIVSGYSMKANNLATRAGFKVGMPYRVVADLYGTGQIRLDKDKGNSYIYSNKRLQSFTFYTDKSGIITEIYVGQEW